MLVIIHIKGNLTNNSDSELFESLCPFILVLQRYTSFSQSISVSIHRAHSDISIS